jgi:hypothetical protein
MAAIIWSKDMQLHSRNEIEKFLSQLLWLVPGWVHVIYINLYSTGDEPGELISIRVMYDYRQATLDFCCAWLDEPDDKKLKTVAHELLHIHLNLMGDYARKRFDDLCPKDEAPKFNETLREAITERCEMATQDLAKAICDQFYGGK